VNKVRNILLFSIFALVFGCMKARFNIQVHNATDKYLTAKIDKYRKGEWVEYSFPSGMYQDITDSFTRDCIIKFEVKKKAVTGWRSYVSSSEYYKSELYGSTVMPFQFDDYKDFFAAVIEVSIKKEALKVSVKRLIGGVNNEKFFNKVQGYLGWFIDYRNTVIPARDFYKLQEYKKKLGKFENLIPLFKKLKSNSEFKKADGFFAKVINDIKIEIDRCKGMVRVLNEGFLVDEKRYKKIANILKEDTKKMRQLILDLNEKIKKTEKSEEVLKSKEFKQVAYYKEKIDKLLNKCEKIRDEKKEENSKIKKKIDMKKRPKYVNFFNKNLMARYEQDAGKYLGLSLHYKRSVNNLLKNLPEDYYLVIQEYEVI